MHTYQISTTHTLPEVSLIVGGGAVWFGWLGVNEGETSRSIRVRSSEHLSAFTYC